MDSSARPSESSHHHEVNSSLTRSEIMRRVRSQNTTPERAVRASLRRLGIRPSRRKLPGAPDFVLPVHHAVIFVHGCFWHRHGCTRGCRTPSTNRPYWIEKFRKNVIRDRRVARRLRHMGWRVLTIWECRTKDPTRLDQAIRAKVFAPRRMGRIGE